MEKNAEQLINKLIKKRKQENDAFIKLLSAIEIKTGVTEENVRPGKKRKE